MKMNLIAVGMLMALASCGGISDEQRAQIYKSGNVAFQAGDCVRHLNNPTIPLVVSDPIGAWSYPTRINTEVIYFDPAFNEAIYQVYNQSNLRLADGCEFYYDQINPVADIEEEME